MRELCAALDRAIEEVYAETGFPPVKFALGEQALQKLREECGPLLPEQRGPFPGGVLAIYRDVPIYELPGGPNVGGWAVWTTNSIKGSSIPKSPQEQALFEGAGRWI